MGIFTGLRAGKDKTGQNNTLQHTATQTNTFQLLFKLVKMLIKLVVIYAGLKPVGQNTIKQDII